MPLWAPNTFGDPGQDSGDFGPKIGGNHPNMMFYSGTKRYYYSQSFSNRAHASPPECLNLKIEIINPFIKEGWL